MDKREKWNERYSKKELRWSAGPNQLFAQLAIQMSPGRVLDVATGEGRNAIWLAELGWQVDAIDFSKAGINKGQQIADLKEVQVNWIVDDVCSHAFAHDCYDLVAVLYLHTAEEERNIWWPKLIESVKPGGSLIYIAHDPQNIAHGVGGPQDVSLLPSVDELKTGLSDFDLRRAGVVERAVDSDPGHGGEDTGVALDTLVWAVRRL